MAQKNIVLNVELNYGLIHKTYITNLAHKIRYATLSFHGKSPLSGAEKCPDFQVTSCYHFVTTNVDFAYIKSE